MSQPKPKVGTVGWIDLVVDDAEGVRDFYADVVGWEPESVGVGDYDDFNMKTPGDGKPTAGVCHRRGLNQGIPSAWMIYITVADLNHAVQRVRALGGEVVHGPTDLGTDGRYTMIRDPAGAVCALFQAAG